MIIGEYMKNYDYILFDLDGTLTESAAGVRLSIEHTMDALGLSCPDLSDYTLYIGPPLEDTFRGMCAVPEELVQTVVSALFRLLFGSSCVKCISELFLALLSLF